VRAATPEWVLEALKDIDPDVRLGFEEETEPLGNNWQSMIEEINEREMKTFPITDNGTDNEDEVQILGGEDKETVVMQSIKSLEEAWNDKMHVKQEKTEEEESEREEVTEQLQSCTATQWLCHEVRTYFAYSCPSN
jgi:hypothetical protein